jgi:hypothetical protein
MNAPVWTVGHAAPRRIPRINVRSPTDIDQLTASVTGCLENSPVQQLFFA